MTKGRRPDGFRVDFFGIGAPRARTTWLAQCLDEHPQITISKIKEPEFFVKDAGIFETHRNARYKADWDWYVSQWDHAGAGSLRGDFSINLLHNAETAPHDIKKEFPDAKFIAVLRDPVARMYSHYWYTWGRYRHWGGVPETFEDAMNDETLLRRSRYATNLERWFNVFPRERFRIIIGPDIRQDPAAVVRDTYRFLDVDDSFDPPSLTGRVNAPEARRGLYGSLYRASQSLRRAGLGPVINAVKRLGVVGIVNRLDYKDIEYSPIAPETDKALRDHLRPEIERLEALLGRDLSEWKETPNQSTRSLRRRKMKSFTLRPPPTS